VDIQGISDPAQVNQILFAPDGLATKFIKGPAAPFVGRDLKRGYYAREALGRSRVRPPQGKEEMPGIDR
jgi:type VI secretion system protein ImpL